MALKHSKLDVLQSASPSEQSSSHEDEEEDSHLTPQPKPNPHSESESEPEPVARSKAVAKRPAETRAGRRESKKGKVDVAVQKATVRVWSEEEEIAILKGVQKIGPNPCSDMEAFHLVKKSLQAEASRNKLYDKVRRLKRKYCDNVKRVKKDESVSSSWKTHEKKLFDLSRTIWGGEDDAMQSPKSEKKRSARNAKKLEMSF